MPTYQPQTEKVTDPLMWSVVDLSCQPDGPHMIRVREIDDPKDPRMKHIFRFEYSKHTGVPIVFAQKFAANPDTFEVYRHDGRRVRAIMPKATGGVTLGADQVIATLTDLNPNALARLANKIPGHQFNENSPADQMIAVLLSAQGEVDGGSTLAIDTGDGDELVIVDDGNGTLNDAARDATNRFAPREQLTVEEDDILDPGEKPGAKTTDQLLQEAVDKNLVEVPPKPNAALERAIAQQERKNRPKRTAGVSMAG